MSSISGLGTFLLIAVPMILFFVIFGFVAADQMAQKPSTDNELLTYKEPGGGITFRYPSDWEIKDQGIASKLEDQYDLVSFEIPKLLNTTSPTVISLNVQNLPSDDVNLRDYVKAQYNYLKENITGLQLVSDNSIIAGGINGKPAWQLEFSFDNTKVHTAIIYIINADKAYTILLGSENSSFASDWKLLKKMIDTIEFTE